MDLPRRVNLPTLGNGYPMDDEAYKAFPICMQSVKKGADIVILIHSPEGCVGHYLTGRFGKNYGGRLFTPQGKGSAQNERRIILAPHHSKADESYYGEGSIWVKSWAEGLEELRSVHGNKARVAVYPTAPIQISEEEAARP